MIKSPEMEKKLMKKTRAAIPEKIDYPLTEEELTKRVKTVFDLLLEFFHINNINDSDGISAMSSLILTILSEYEDPKQFYLLIRAMVNGFEKNRNL